MHKKLALWSLYNYANAILFVIFTLYFSEWLVIDRGLSDFWFNATYVISSVLFLFTVPFAAEHADATGTARLVWLRLTTLLAFLFFFMTSAIAAFYPEHYITAAVTFTLAVWLYLFAGVFYNALLADVADSETYGRATGWSQFSDWLGEISGVLIALPLVGGSLVVLGVSGRALAFMPASFLFLALSLPMLIGYKERSSIAPAAGQMGSPWHRFFELCQNSGVGWFLLSFFLFNDAIITLSNNFTIYLDRVFSVNDTVKSFLLLGILVSSAIGAIVSGRVVDRLGPKKALMWILAGWIILLPLLAITTNFTIFIAIAIAVGIWLGAMYVTARVLMARLAPSSSLNTAFTYYSLMERLATILGPLTWGLLVMYIPHTAALNYHIAVIGMALFVILGFFVALKIPEPEPANSVT